MRLEVVSLGVWLCVEIARYVRTDRTSREALALLTEQMRSPTTPVRFGLITTQKVERDGEEMAGPSLALT